MTESTERRIRIGDWLMPYDDALVPVEIERTIADILRATPGDAFSCMNSECIKAQRNTHAFPHPVFVVHTSKTRVVIVDRLSSSGVPAHCVRYELSKKDAEMINVFDRTGAGQPGTFTLRVPHDPKGSPRRKASSQGGRFGDLGPGKRFSGVGKNLGRKARPVTTHSLGAPGRFMVAALSLKDIPAPTPTVLTPSPATTEGNDA